MLFAFGLGKSADVAGSDLPQGLQKSCPIAILEGFSEFPKGFTFLCQFKRHHELASQLMCALGTF